MEGKKAFILPAIAALVFGALLWVRSSANELAGASGDNQTPAALAERVRAAIAADTTASLKPSALSKLQPAIEAAVAPCAASAPEVRSLKLTVEVAAAAGVGSVVESAAPVDLPEPTVACVRAALSAFEGPDIGQTGRLSTTMQLALAPTPGARE